MLYYNSLDFYLHMKRFMSAEFTCVRKAYLYDLLSNEDNQKVLDYVHSLFPDKFIKLIKILRKKYRADNVLILLTKFLKNLGSNFDNIVCYIETHEVFEEEKLIQIEEGLKKRFEIENIMFKYKVNPSLLFGISVRLNYKIYHLNLNNLFEKIRKKIISDLREEEKV